ncbi:MAG: THUMP domain-containing protein [Candidatus Aenigmarchaeota archaeon]|nr:THUMP domain-containing protein [Candidatus Aenigmarchaeota archaeon]
MTEANLLITYDPSHAGRAKEEIAALLGAADDDGKFMDSEIEGVFLLRTKKDPKETVKKMVHECKRDAGKFRYTFNWVPIEKWCSSGMEEMSNVMREFDARIDANKKWKMELNKRQYDKHKTIDLIMALTDKITKPNVDLKNPDIVVKVEIIGNKAGCSLLKKDEVLNVPSVKS